jgi:TolB-like protein/Tfp pilus assembly protein PilF
MPKQTAKAIKIFSLGLFAVTLWLSPTSSALLQNSFAAVQAQAIAPVRMVVLPFKNITQKPEDAWLGESFSESLTMALTQVSQVQVIERSQIQAVLQEQSFTQSAFVDPKSAPELGKILGANKVLLGNFQKIGKTLIVNTRVVDVNSGQIETSLSTQVQGPAQDVLELQSQLSRLFLQNYTTNPILALPQLTQSNKALNVYQQALEQGRRESIKDLEEAIGLLEIAITEDPKFAAAHATLADFLARLAIEKMPGTERTTILDRSLQVAHQALGLGASPILVYPALANSYFAKGERAKGLDTLRAALQAQPNNTDSLLAYLRFNEASPQEQEQELKRLGVEMQNPWVQFALGSRYLKRAQSALEPETAYALQLLRQAQIQMPKYALIPLRIAEIFVLNQDYPKAQASIQAALELDPNNFLLYFLAARAFFSSPEPALVQAWLERSIELNPHFGYSQMTLGYFHSRHGSREKALELFKQAEAIFPESVALAFVRGKTHFLRREYEQARPFLLQALKQVNDGPNEQIPKGALYFKLGEIEADAGNFPAAIRYYNLATGEDRTHKAWAYLKLSRIYASQKAFSESLIAFNNYLKSSGFRLLTEQNRDQASLAVLQQAQLHPNDPALLSELGRYALLDADYTLAEKYFMQALEQNPNNDSIRYNLALCLFYQQDWSASIRELQSVLKSNPEHEKAHYNLGLAYLRNQEVEKARQTWLSLLTKNPQNLQAREALAQLNA